MAQPERSGSTECTRRATHPAHDSFHDQQAASGTHITLSDGIQITLNDGAVIRLPSKSLTLEQAAAVSAVARSLPIMELRPGLKDVRRRQL
jgi:hypothetical protein